MDKKNNWKASDYTKADLLAFIEYRDGQLAEQREEIKNLKEVEVTLSKQVSDLEVTLSKQVSDLEAKQRNADHFDRELRDLQIKNNLLQKLIERFWELR